MDKYYKKIGNKIYYYNGKFIPDKEQFVILNPTEEQLIAHRWIKEESNKEDEN